MLRVIVTGASRGIGRGIAKYLAHQRCQVGLIARSGDLLVTLADEIREAGGQAYPAPCDLRDAETVEASVQGLADLMGGVDVLINNAGLVVRKSIFEISPEEWRDVMDTNVTGLFHATRAVLPHLREQGHGHIINLSSISGRLPLRNGSAYAASKFAVTGFSRSLFLEVRDLGIKVTTLFPGSVETASHQSDGAHESADWKVRPEEIGKVCWDILRTPPGTCVSEVEIRPLSSPPASGG